MTNQFNPLLASKNTSALFQSSSILPCSFKESSGHFVRLCVDGLCSFWSKLVRYTVFTRYVRTYQSIITIGGAPIAIYTHRLTRIAMQHPIANPGSWYSIWHWLYPAPPPIHIGTRFTIVALNPSVHGGHAAVWL